MPPSPHLTADRRSRLAVIFLAAIVALSTACASRGQKGGPTLAPAPDQSRQSVAARGAVDEAAIVHLLNRMTFGVRPQDVELVRRSGFEAFLEQQMHPERIDDSALQQRLASFQTLGLSSRQLADDYYLPAQQARRRQQLQVQAATQQTTGSMSPGGTGSVTPPSAAPRPAVSPADQELFRRAALPLQELSEQKLLRAVYSERQFQEVLVDFWFNHFNVFAGKGADRGLLTEYERDVIRPRVFGKFRDLLGTVAESPAMLFYLDNWLSVDPNGPHPLAARGRMPARLPRRANRGLIGLMLPPPRAPEQQQPAVARPKRGLNENYARELMELHTLGVDGGYTQHDVIEVARCFTGWTIAQPRDGGEFRFDERQHDPGQKTVMAHVIKAGGGKEDGDRVLDILARDPHTARFIATKLVRRFVADDPPPVLVDRVARRFRETDGDLRAVYRAIFLSPEFRSASAYDTKVKTPLELVASAARATRAEITDARPLVQAVRTLGMPLYFCQPPTGYADRADAWLNTGTLVTRMNFALALAENRLPGVRVNVADLAGTSDVAAAREPLARLLVSSGPSPATLEVLSRASSLPQVVALAVGSPEFQRR